MRPRRDEGFNLIELVVVVLVIGLLVAIAAPTFLQARSKASTRAATSNLRSALTAMKTVYAQQFTYESVAVGAPVTQGVLNAANPSPGWGADGGASPTPSTGPETVSWQGVGNVVVLATRSTDGDCFYIQDDVNASSGGTRFGRDSTTPCVATGFSGTWQPSPREAGW